MLGSTTTSHKTKEVVVDPSSGSEVERVDTFKYLGATISQNLCWAQHIGSTVKQIRQLILPSTLFNDDRNCLTRFL